MDQNTKYVDRITQIKKKEQNLVTEKETVIFLQWIKKLVFPANKHAKGSRRL